MTPPGLPGEPLAAARDADVAPLRIGAIGAGRVGAPLAAALRAAGHDVVAVSGDSDSSRRRAADLLPGVPVLKPTEVARRSDLLLLTVPDDMLGNVVSSLAGAGVLRAGQVVLHTSGRHGLSVLDAAAAHGARVIAAHPAMTFTGTAEDLPRLPGCAVGVTADPAELPLAARIVADLGARLVTVEESQRALYHGALAHGSNHLVTLVSEAAEMLTAAGVDATADVLRPLLEAALANALRDGDSALTGPVVRGDVETVRAHVAGLRAEAPQALASYVALARATKDRATLDGRLLPIRAAALDAVLDAGAEDAQQPATPARRGAADGAHRVRGQGRRR